MSKMDNLRAMREARFERATQPVKAQPRRAGPAKNGPAGAQSSQPQPTEQEPAEQPPEESTEELCGHRAISGRTCTRERGHAAKSHRYS